MFILKKQISASALFCLAAIVLAGCGKDMRQAIGLDKPAIESDVTKVPPLTLPPEFTLRPPQDGSAPTQRQLERSREVQKRARNANVTIRKAPRRRGQNAQDATIPSYEGQTNTPTTQDCKKVVLNRDGQYVCEDS